MITCERQASAKMTKRGGKDLVSSPYPADFQWIEVASRRKGIEIRR